VNKEQRIIRSWSEVLTREMVAEGTAWLELGAPEIAAQVAPGQFVMVGFGARGWGVPFLPRPNSVAGVRGDAIGLLVRVYGEGSRRIAALRPGDSVLLLGPLGQPYDVSGVRKVVCVAGGVGLAPFLLLPGWARSRGLALDVKLLYGERSATAVFDPQKIREISSLDAEIWTEDGGLGQHGLVTAGIDLREADLLLSCGPTPMLKAVRRLALDAGIPCQLAVEAHMACGVGTCIGCAIPTVDATTGEEKYSLVCQEGPVFSGERLRW
jgi:dihydroorotate dehydrogenase electron transfer subunit